MLWIFFVDVPFELEHYWTLLLLAPLSLFYFSYLFVPLDANWKGICIPGSGISSVNELWVDKYKPHSLEELAVHKKKVSIFPLFCFCLSTLLDVYIEVYSFSWYFQVEEVKSWFEERLKTTKVNLYLSKPLPLVLFPWRSTCFLFYNFFFAIYHFKN